MLLRPGGSCPSAVPNAARGAYSGAVSGPEDAEPTGEQLLLGAGRFPPDARRMGIDRYSDDGALIAFAAALDPARPRHKMFAWFLIAVMLAPLALTIRYLVG
jgi:hypothetical protein